MTAWHDHAPTKPGLYLTRRLGHSGIRAIAEGRAPAPGTWSIGAVVSVDVRGGWFVEGGVSWPCDGWPSHWQWARLEWPE